MRFEPDRIVNVVCQCLGLERSILLSQYKGGEYIDGRFIAIYLIKHYNPLFPYTHIAKLFNKKQHGSAMNAHFKCQDYLDTNSTGFREKLETVKSKLNTNGEDRKADQIH